MKCCVIKVDDRIFCKEAILKASYFFVDRFYVHLSYREGHYISIELTPKPGIDATGVDRSFENELIAQMVRYQVSQSNKDLKELILGRALYSTCIDRIQEPESPEDDEVSFPSLDEIAVDWFEQNETSAVL